MGRVPTDQVGPAGPAVAGELRPAKIRPPLQRLPGSKAEASRDKGSGPEIYLSWDGGVFGPCSAEDVDAGIRAASFEEYTYFWFEGRDQWQLLEDFAEAIEEHRVQASPFTPRAPVVEAPGEAVEDDDTGLPVPKRRRRQQPPAKVPHQRDHGHLIVLLFVFLAVALTVGLIYVASLF